MTATQFSMTYKGTLGEGVCHATVFIPEGLHDPGVIVVTEHGANPGPSITNAVEAIAVELERILHLPRLDGYHLIEHYPANSHRPATYDQVELTWTDRGPHSPVWRRVTVEELDQMVQGSHRPADVLRRFETCDVFGSYIERGWTIDAAGRWHEPITGRQESPA